MKQKPQFLQEFPYYHDLSLKSCLVLIDLWSQLYDDIFDRDFLIILFESQEPCPRGEGPDFDPLRDSWLVVVPTNYSENHRAGVRLQLFNVMRRAMVDILENNLNDAPSRVRRAAELLRQVIQELGKNNWHQIAERWLQIAYRIDQIAEEIGVKKTLWNTVSYPH